MAVQFDRDRLEKALRSLGRGEMDRRGFLMAAGAAGITAAAADTMLFANAAYAQSTRVAAPKAAADYIVIGAGSGGAAVAGRLSMLTDASVLVLEGGIDDRTPVLADDISNPGKWPLALASPFTRMYETTPQKHAEDRVVAYPRGEGLGGCSSVNCMIYNRGAAADYDTWAYDGAEGWDWKSVLAAYKEMEDWQGGASELRGAGGPLHVTRPDPKLGHPGAHAFINGAVSLGYPEVFDFNGGKLEGPAWVNFTVYGGKRQSSAVAFLRPAMEKRRPLTVLTEAPVLNLVIEKGRCVGVRYLHNGKPVTVRANKEVILAAGAIATPQLLMLSGIGDPAALKALGVSPVVDLVGVGQNLQDHVLGAGVNYEAKGPVPPSNYNSSEVYMWWKSDSSQPVADISSLYLSVPFATPEMNMSKAAGYSICSGVMRPKSRGSVTLNSLDPHAKPLIDPNYLAVDQDLRALKAATDISRAIGESDAYKDIRKGEVIPGALANDPVAYRDFLRKSVSTFFHPVGTTKMGVDAGAVVDAKLRVYGIEGLRVSDCSVMPSITTGNTNAPTMMIGWRAAAMIAQG